MFLNRSKVIRRKVQQRPQTRRTIRRTLETLEHRRLLAGNTVTNPTDLQVVEVGQDNISLTWNAPSKGKVSSYVVAYDESVMPNVGCESGDAISTSSREVTLNSLASGTEYFVRVCSSKNGDLSPGITTSATTIGADTKSTILAVNVPGITSGPESNVKDVAVSANGDVFVAYVQEAQGYRDLVYQHYDSSQVVWSNGTLFDGSAQSRHVGITAPGQFSWTSNPDPVQVVSDDHGNFTIGWMTVDGTDDHHEIHGQRFEGSTATLAISQSTLVHAMTDSGNNDDAHLHGCGKGFTLAMARSTADAAIGICNDNSRGDGGRGHIFMSVLNGAGTSWEKSPQLDEAFEHATGATIAMDHDGDIMMVWAENPGDHDLTRNYAGAGMHNVHYVVFDWGVDDLQAPDQWHVSRSGQLPIYEETATEAGFEIIRLQLAINESADLITGTAQAVVGLDKDNGSIGIARDAYHPYGLYHNGSEWSELEALSNDSETGRNLISNVEMTAEGHAAIMYVAVDPNLDYSQVGSAFGHFVYNDAGTPIWGRNSIDLDDDPAYVDRVFDYSDPNLLLWEMGPFAATDLQIDDAGNGVFLWIDSQQDLRMRRIRDWSSVGNVGLLESTSGDFPFTDANQHTVRQGSVGLYPRLGMSATTGEGQIVFTEGTDLKAVAMPAISAEPNDPPTADAGTGQSGNEDEAITFDATSSTDPDGDPLLYAWDFGDGTSMQTTDPSVSHSYAYGGSFSVHLTVTDTAENQSTDTTTATIVELNDVPMPNAGGPYRGTDNTPITFDASASSDFDNVDGTTANDQTLEYVWDFGDGTIRTTGTPTIEHLYAATGTYAVELTVIDGLSSSVVASTTAVIDPEATGSDTDIYIYSISFESRRRGNDWRAVFEVRNDANADGLGDGSDPRVAGVSITVTFNGKTFTGTSDANGMFRTSWQRNLTSGTYQAEVVDLALSSLIWNTAIDLEDDSDGDGLPDAELTI